MRDAQVAEGAFSWGTSVNDLYRRRARPMNDLPLEVKKAVRKSGGRKNLKIHYRLTNTSSRRLKFLFATQTTLPLKDAHVNRVGQAQGILRFAVVDPMRRLQVSWVLSKAAHLWYFPLESGRGMRRLYHGVSLSYLWPLTLSAGDSWEVTYRMKVAPPDGFLSN